MILNFANFLSLIACVAIIFSPCNGQTEYETRSCGIINGRRTQCLALRQCDYFLNYIKSQGINSPAVRQTLEDNNCGYIGYQPKLCCPVQGGGGGTNPTPPTNPTSLLPEKCGIDQEGNKIVGGEVTDLGEFPWMAVLEYDKGYEKITGCGGVLISRRYVLTAAHCIKLIPSTWRLRRVRLGEYNLNTDPDCIDDGNGGRYCADPVQIVGIEEMIVHENFMSPARFRNDIALLRLDRDIRNSEFIFPICLPPDGNVGRTFWSAGWGQTENRLNSEVKLKIKLPFFDFDQCYNSYATKRVYLGNGQICAGGNAQQDTCKGDSGGPLMREIRQRGVANNKWVVDGVVSFGYSPCGRPGWPAVYTKVYNYVPWIISKLRP